MFFYRNTGISCNFELMKTGTDRSESYGVSPNIPPVGGKRAATQPPPSGPHPSNLATAHLS